MIADLLFGSHTAGSQGLIASSEHRFRPSQECVVQPRCHPWYGRKMNTRNQNGGGRSGTS
jgi:hypothetical protein